MSSSDFEMFKTEGLSLKLSGSELVHYIRERQREAAELEKQKADLERDERIAQRNLEQAKAEAEVAKQKALVDAEVLKEKARLEVDAARERDRLEFEAKEKDRVMQAEEREKERVFELERARLQASHPISEPNIRLKLPNFDESKDDLDSYLFRFEQHARSCRWPADMWGVYLAAHLSGKALNVYHAMSLGESQSYADIKHNLLKKFRCSEEGFRRRFRDARPEDGETIPFFLTRIRHSFTRWIELSGITQTYDQLFDLLLREQLLQSCSQDLVTHLKEMELKTAQEMAEAGERYREAHHKKSMARPVKSGDLWVGCSAKEDNSKDYQRGVTRGGFGSPRGHGPRREFEGRRSPRGGRGGVRPSHATPTSGGANQSNGEVVCSKCLRRGHWARNCRTFHLAGVARLTALKAHGDGEHCAQKTDGNFVPPPCGHSLPTLFTGEEGRCGSLRVFDGRVGGQAARILRDTGCTTVGVKSSLVKDEEYTGETARCISFGGNVEEFPVAEIEVNTPFFKGKVRACVVERPVCDLILGNLPGVLDTPELIVGPELAANVAQTRSQTAKGNRPFRPLQTAKAPKLDVGPEQLSQLQKDDRELTVLFEKAASGEKFRQKNCVVSFEIVDGLLYRVFNNTRSSEEVRQLVVPTPLRKSALVAAHDSVMAGHSGVTRTTKRLLTHFFWPGIRREVKKYCRTCDTCQRTVPRGRIPPAPLQQMPAIDVPFKRIAIDLVGPFKPASARGHRYILTIVDMATRFPEAVPMKQIDTEAVAEALLSVFSRMGCPEEILSDRGSQFTSDLMKEVMRLLSVRQLTTSPYHAQANGMVERFNGTLKMMLRRMANERPADWDRYIPALLFAYRELPNDSTGFSPFELLYGRTPRGPMAILKEIWTGKRKDTDVQTTYQYVLELRNSLAETCKIAQEAAQKAGQRYKHYHDKKAKMRKFNVGDEVLVLLPTEQNKLLMKWQGPYIILNVSGPVDYRIDMNGKSKIFHVNMLKKYERRTDDGNVGAVVGLAISAVGVVSLEEDMGTPQVDVKTLPTLNEESVKDVHYDPDLPVARQRDLQNVFEKFSGCLTDKPGNTVNVDDHSIPLTTPQPIRLKSYPIPFAKREEIRKEVKSMLDLGVIEPSTSSYSSPIVLVKKKDGTNRFCIDFRALNKVTVFDAEPIPDTEELFARLTKARFFTKIDLAKGYWQIPVKQEDRHKTAFQTPLGLYQWTKMPFGLVSAPASFARMMRKLKLEENSALNFFDDILIATERWDDHLESVKGVLQKLQKFGLTARPTKIFAGFQTLEFLGHTVGKGTMQPEKSKVDKILSLGQPRTKKQVRGIVGLMSYYRRYVPDFASLISPLTDLTKKGQPNKVQWDHRCQNALERIQQILSQQPVVVLPDLTKPFTVKTDASSRGIGGVLCQEKDGLLHPVLYASRKLLDREQRYSTVERECLAIVWSIDKFSRYLYGQEFMLETDHRPLTYLRQSKLKNSRLMRWALALQEYKFHILPVSGKSNVEADALSRCLQDQVV